jgi:predicted lipid-binding transport protein (Tim44 family)
VPESKGRAKPTHSTPPNKPSKKITANPPWFVPVMLGLMVVGLLWVVTFYIMEGKAPIPGINYWNLIIGFGLMISGFMMTTRWR